MLTPFTFVGAVFVMNDSLRVKVLAFLLFSVAVPGLRAACSGTATNAICSNTAAITFAGGAGTPDRPASPYPSSNVVSGMSGNITKVSVRFNNFSPVNPDDLEFLLVSPSGQSLILMADAGGFTAVSNLDITLDDAAAAQLPNATALSTGTFRPTAYSTANFPGSGVSLPNYPAPEGVGTFAGIFNGANPNGSWFLYAITDSAGLAEGSMDGGWSLLIETVVQTPTLTTVTSSLNPSFLTDSVTFTATVTAPGSPAITGTVTFFQDGTPAGTFSLDGNGQASFSTSSLTEGSHLITATYSGAGVLQPSTGNLTQRVNRLTTVNGNQFCNVGSLPIPAALNGTAQPYPSNIVVSGFPGALSRVTLSLNGLTIDSPDDVDFLLVGPGGQKFVALASAGGANPLNGVNLVLDDSAASLLPDSTAISSGTWRPTAYGSPAFPAPAPVGPYSIAAPSGGATFASTFSGVPNGTWQLFTTRHVAGTAGSLSGGWCVSITTVGDPTTTSVTSTPNPSSVGGLVTFTAQVRNQLTTAAVTTGSVTFFEGPTSLAGPIALNASGQAAFSTSALAQGSHTIRAEYGGTPNVFAASSGSTTQVVNAALPATISKSFTPAIVAPNSNAALTFMVSNPNAAIALSAIEFTDLLPAGLRVASPNGLAGVCGGGTITAPAGGVSVALTGAALGGGASCTFSVNVASPTTGTFPNSVTINSSAGVGNTAQATLEVRLPVTLTKAFGAVSIGMGSVTSLTFTVVNPNPISVTGISFSDGLPAGLLVASPNALGGTCTGNTIAPAGSTTVMVTNLSLLAGGSCTLIVNVVGSALGLQANTTSTVTSNEAPIGAVATASLNVGDPFQITYFANLPAGDSVINITNPGALGAGLPAGTSASTTGAICVNAYAFSPDEQMISCCSCPVTPNGLVSLSVRNDLISNTLTPAVPTSIVVKLLATVPAGGSCNGSAASTSSLTLANSLSAWGTKVHAAPAAGFAVTETPFQPGTLSAGELNRLSTLCSFINATGSGFGICRSCRLGGLGAGRI